MDNEENRNTIILAREKMSDILYPIWIAQTKLS